MAKRSKFKTSVGGQAVMEGVMMKGTQKWCLAVRVPNGEIVTEVHENPKRNWTKIPIVRGVASFFDSLLTGYKTLMRSAELALTEEEEQEELSKFDIWIEKYFGEKGMKIMMVLSSVLGMVLAIGLFMFLPTLIVRGINSVVELGFMKVILEGVIKIGLFVVYLALVSKMKEIHRVFSYHGAEHKTISCYEAGEELTVENIRKNSRFHPRCGTSFILIVLIISILANAILPWSGALIVRTGLKLLMLPVVMGIAYEIIRLAGRYDNFATKIISTPGLWLQRLTTKEPDDEMIEVAIAAVLPVLPIKPEEATW